MPQQTLNTAMQLYQQGKLALARSDCADLLTKHPTDTAALRLLAMIATDQGKTREAQSLLLQILEITPRSSQALGDMARFYLTHNRYDEAIEYQRRLVHCDPHNADAQLKLATTLSIVGLPEQAILAYDAAEKLLARSTVGGLGRAHVLRALGRTAEAISIYRESIKRDIKACEAWWSLSSLRTYQFTDDEFTQMLNTRPNTKRDSTLLHFAMAKALDDRQDFDAAWAHYKAGNLARRQDLPYDAVRVESEFDSIIQRSPQLLRETSNPQQSSAASQSTPIFIVGMPRSGSTLVEQILASHSKVEATSELPYMLNLGKAHIISQNPEDSDETAEMLQGIAGQYLKACQQHQKGQEPYFIDKMPDNFQMIGLISQVFPQAKIIDIRRHPLDTCIANYRQFYPRGKNFSYDLFELAEYYLQYLRLMRHWDEVLPGKVLRVHYEDLIENPSTEIAEILSYCGLPWENACMSFHQTERAISSASSEQVRQPLFNTSIGFWKHYKSHLTELIEILHPAIEKTSDKAKYYDRACVSPDL
ncbi:MAG: sulfotransferase [Pseudomonadales bacterium]